MTRTLSILDRSTPRSPREQLLEAGLDVFGEHGYNAATTRMIAKRAGMNIAAIPYYFNGKRGLYHAVVELVTETIVHRLQAPLDDIEKALTQTRPGPREARELFERLLMGLIDLMVGSKEAQRFMRIILREQLYPSPAYDLLFSRFMEPMLTPLSQLVGLATNSTSSRESVLRAFSLLGQVLVFRIGRETMVRSLGLDGYSPEETQEIRNIVLEQTRAALGRLNGASQLS